MSRPVEITEAVAITAAVRIYTLKMFLTYELEKSDGLDNGMSVSAAVIEDT